MTLVPLRIPPGVLRNGTKYQSLGRWYDANLVRFIEGTIRPLGGWQTLKDNANAAVTVAGAPRTMRAWRAGGGTEAWLAIGTNTKAYAYKTGTLTDITIAGLTTGGADAVQSIGNYGGGNYGSGVYGQGEGTVATTTDPAVWHMDTFGDHLVACLPEDGRILKWDLNTSNDLVVVTNAPTSCKGVVVTPERFIFALGAGGDGRKVEWPDQENFTTWTPASGNQAGNFLLEGTGSIKAGRRGQGETLIWTDTELFVAQYIGGTLVYSFRKKGTDCGLIAPEAVAMIGGRAIWMGQRGFYEYNGFVQEIPCEIADYVFTDFNVVQKAKVTAQHFAEMGEIKFFYPSRGSTAIDRYVIYNYREKHWTPGKLNRSAGVDRGVFPTPIMANESGALYTHESTFDRDGYTGDVPSLESGPIQVGDAGDQVFMMRELVPDEKTQGDVRMYLYAGNYPQSTEATYGPFTAALPTNVRITARQMRVRFEQVNAVDWRIGQVRFDAVAGGRR